MATSAEGALGYPEWTSLEKKRGLDPLGMQTTSIALYQQLLPGISNVTLRMRYYGLYAWLADWYAKTVRTTDIEQWCRFLRRTEALYALVAQRAGNERGIPGSRWAARTLGDQDAITFSDWTDRQSPNQYLQQKFGAFGAAYGSQLLEVGVLTSVATQAGHNIPVPSVGLGDALASAFEREAGGAAAVFLEAIEAGTVTPVQLVQIGPMLPSRIPVGSQERQLYEDMLFGKGEVKDRGATQRAQTLRLLLRMAAEYEAPLNPDLVRWSLYAGCRTDGSPLQPMPEADGSQAFSWRVYQANDILHACYEALLRYVLDVLETFPQGISLPTLLDVVVQRVSSELDWQPQSWAALVEETPEPERPLERAENSDWTFSQEVLQAGAYMAISSPQTVRSALKLLAVLYRRFHPLLESIRSKLPVLGTGPFAQSLLTELELFDRNSSLPWSEFLSDLLRTRVIDRHIWVAMQKLRAQSDYTFLIEADNGLLRMKQKDGPVFTNPRLGPAITFLEDIHLMGPKGPTPRGWTLLEAA